MLTSELRYGDLWSMREFNHFDFELNGIIRAFYALRLMISWIASTIFGVHYPLRNIRICQTVLRRRLHLIRQEYADWSACEVIGTTSTSESQKAAGKRFIKDGFF